LYFQVDVAKHLRQNNPILPDAIIHAASKGENRILEL
jgi:hypothetical protein